MIWKTLKEKKRERHGFTLTELVVVLAIFSILAATAVMSISAWQKHSEYIKNEDYAKTMFLTAQLSLSNMDQSGTLDSFLLAVEQDGTQLKNVISASKISTAASDAENEAASDAEKEQYQQQRYDKAIPNFESVYAIGVSKDGSTAIASGANAAKQNELVNTLLSNYTMDNNVLSGGSYIIEIDVKSGTVFSVFYNSWATSLQYSGLTAASSKLHGVVYVDSRDGFTRDRQQSTRQEYVTGYYSDEDVGNVANLVGNRLRLRNVLLTNDEELKLSWSCTGGNYFTTYYQIEVDKVSADGTTKTPALYLELDLKALQDNSGITLHNFSAYNGQSSYLGQAPWENTLNQSGYSYLLLPVTAKSADGGSWSQTQLLPFAVTTSGSHTSFSLVLDAAMTAEAQQYLTGLGGSYSLTRFIDGQNKQVFTEDERLCASVTAVSTEQGVASSIGTTDTTHHSFFDDSSASVAAANGIPGTTTYGISRLRHLYNIRYVTKSAEEQVTFALTRNLNWKNAVIYGYDASKSYLMRQTDPAFPTIVAYQPDQSGYQDIWHFGSGWTLTGTLRNYMISNLKLDNTSIAKLETTQEGGVITAQVNHGEGIGLLLRSSGTVEHLNLRNVTMTAAYDPDRMDSLHAVGSICAYNSGILSAITLTSQEDMTTGISRSTMTADVLLNKADAQAGASGIGGLAGVSSFGTTSAERDASAKTAAGSAVENCSVDVDLEGTITITGEAPTGADSVASRNQQYSGIGGVLGAVELYLHPSGDAYDISTAQGVVFGCTSSGFVKANLNGGGIVGSLKNWAYEQTNGSSSQIEETSEPAVMNCTNEGMVLCTVQYNGASSSYAGKNAGGIVGLSSGALLRNCTSTPAFLKGVDPTGLVYQQSGTAGEGSWNYYMKGDCVGGILGYGTGCVINGCGTDGGYVVGEHYIGGIAGYLEQTGRANSIETMQGDYTVNHSNVVGSSSVGGIVGQNGAGSTLKSCTNRGIVAAANINVGGIVGKNEGTETELAIIEDCTSYVYDYAGTLYSTLKKWNLYGSNSGGIAGYNQWGEILYKTVGEEQMVSSVVVGSNNVGGVVGMNGPNGTIDLQALVVKSGRVYGTGNCVGGYIGMNMSETIFADIEDSNKPQLLVIQPSGVEGQLCVGGAIGANILALDKDTTIRIVAQNPSGTVTGGAMVGGAIGYSRTLPTVEYAQELCALWQTTPIAKDFLMDDDGNLVTSEQKSSYTLYIDGSTGTDTEYAYYGDASKMVCSSGITVKGGLYVGGILGVNDPQSQLVVKNCVNSSTVQYAAGAYPALNFEDSSVYVLGGVVSYNTLNTVLNNCMNNGTVFGGNMMGGICGINEGYIDQCSGASNIGRTAYSYVGGIVGLNHCSDLGKNTTQEYTVNGETYTYITGTVENCSTAAGLTVSGSSYVGGIAGLNDTKATISACTSNSSISGSRSSGSYVGGIAGYNRGGIAVKDTVMGESGAVTVTGCDHVGGVVGGQSGTITSDSANRVIMTTEQVTVNGKTHVGGVIGLVADSMSVGNGFDSYAAVTASENDAGGIAGAMESGVVLSGGRSYGAVQVTGVNGMAGGITASVPTGAQVDSCGSYGSVTAEIGVAGGIAAVNAGNISKSVVSAQRGSLTIRSGASEGESKNYAGVVTAYNTGTIQATSIEAGNSTQITLDAATAAVWGGITGRNDGTVTSCTISDGAISFNWTRTNAQNTYTIGGAAGRNSGTISDTAVEMNLDGGGSGFASVTYVGGIAGINQSTITKCTYSGSIKEVSGTIGSCYGGIAGTNGLLTQSDNRAEISQCTVDKLDLTAVGSGGFAQSDSAQFKTEHTASVGGIAGRNCQGAAITASSLTASDNATQADGTVTLEQKSGVMVVSNGACHEISLKTGLLGGVAGYNAGAIQDSGAIGNKSIYTILTSMENNESAADQQRQADIRETLKTGYYLISMTTVGYSGGITALNAETGSIVNSASGRQWTIYHNCADPDSVSSGVIGYNASAEALNHLVNGADVIKNQKQGVGGVICRQEVQNSSSWVLESCYNFGTVSGQQDRVGGIIGILKFCGGTVKNCHNYGRVSGVLNGTGYSGGIVGGHYMTNTGETMNYYSCTNHGVISGGGWSAGIVGRVAESNNLKVYFTDCANYAEIISGASCGMMGEQSGGNNKYYFNRCANYGFGTGTTGYAIANSAEDVQNCLVVVPSSKSFNYYWGTRTLVNSTDLGTNYYVNADSGTNNTVTANCMEDALPLVPEVDTSDPAAQYWTVMDSGLPTGPMSELQLRIYGSAQSAYIAVWEIELYDDNGNKILVDSSKVTSTPKGGSNSGTEPAKLAFDGNLKTKLSFTGSSTSEQNYITLKIPFVSQVNGVSKIRMIFYDGGQKRAYGYLCLDGSGTELAPKQTVSKWMTTAQSNAISNGVIAAPTPDIPTDWTEHLYSITGSDGKYHYISFSQKTLNGNVVKDTNLIISSSIGYALTGPDSQGIYTVVGKHIIRSEDPADTSESYAPDTAVANQYQAWTLGMNYWDSLVNQKLKTPSITGVAQSGKSITVTWEDANSYTAGYYLQALVLDEAPTDWNSLDWSGSAEAYSFSTTKSTSITVGDLTERYVAVRVKALSTSGTRDSDYGTYLYAGQKALPAPDLALYKLEIGTTKYDLVLNNLVDYAPFVFSGGYSVDEATGAYSGDYNSENTFRISEVWSTSNTTTYYPIDSQKIYDALCAGNSLLRITFPNPIDKGSSIWTAQAEVVSGTAFSSSQKVNTLVGMLTGEGGLNVTVNSSNSKLSGTTPDDLTATVSVRGNTGDFPVRYRVELVKVLNEGDVTTETAISYQEVALSNGSNTVVAFSNLGDLDDKLFEQLEASTATLKARIWLAGTGKGPVYYYWSPDSTHPDTNINYNLSGVESSVYSVAKAANKSSYYREVTFPITTVTAPVLMQNDWLKALYGTETDVRLPARSTDGSSEALIVPMVTDDNRMQYIVAWGAVNDVNAASYEYTVTGIHGGAKTTIQSGTSTDAAVQTQVIGGSTVYYTVLDADSWNYEQMTVSVSTVGKTSGVTIGMTASETYDIKQRLPQIGQPTLSISSSFGLDYDIEWIPEENIYNSHVSGYTVYLRDKTLQAANKTSLFVLGSTDSSTTTLNANLEFYAGDNVEVFVVAEAVDSDTEYVRSTDGITNATTLTKRMEAPTASFTLYDSTSVENFYAPETKYLSENGFTKTELSVRANVTESSRINGSYLLGGLISATAPEPVSGLGSTTSGTKLTWTWDSAGTDATYLVQLTGEKGGVEKPLALMPGHTDVSYEVDTDVLGGYSNLQLTVWSYQPKESFGYDDGEIYVMNYTAAGSGTNRYQAALSGKVGNLAKEWAGYYLIPIIRAASNTAVSSNWALMQQTSDGMIYQHLPKVVLNGPEINSDTGVTLGADAVQVNETAWKNDADKLTDRVYLSGERGAVRWSAAVNGSSTDAEQIDSYTFRVDGKNGHTVNKLTGAELPTAVTVTNSGSGISVNVAALADWHLWLDSIDWSAENISKTILTQIWDGSIEIDDTAATAALDGAVPETDPLPAESDSSDGESPPAESTAPTEDAPPTESTAPTEDAPPTESTAPTEDTPPTESTAPTEDTPPTESTAPTEDAPPTESTAPTEDAPPAESTAPTEDAPPAESSAPAEDAPPTESSAPTEDASSAESSAPTEDASSAESSAPAEDALPAESAPPVQETATSETTKTTYSYTRSIADTTEYTVNTVTHAVTGTTTRTITYTFTDASQIVVTGTNYAFYDGNGYLLEGTMTKANGSAATLYLACNSNTTQLEAMLADGITNLTTIIEEHSFRNTANVYTATYSMVKKDGSYYAASLDQSYTLPDIYKTTTGSYDNNGTFSNYSFTLVGEIHSTLKLAEPENNQQTVNSVAYTLVLPNVEGTVLSTSVLSQPTKKAEVWGVINDTEALKQYRDTTQTSTITFE